jgi:alpha-1,3-rhamnosyl/mannosyltransferase
VKILVNSIPLKTLQTGIGRYVRNLYRAMETVAGGGIRYFSGIRAAGGIPPGGSPRSSMKTIDTLWKLPDPAVFTLRVLHWLAYEGMLRRACGRERFDIYHETGFVPPDVRDVPIVYNIYDLSLLKHREKHPRERVWFFDHFFSRRFRGVAHVLTISEFVKSEIVDTFRVDPDRVSAIPLAPDPVFSPRRKEETDLVLKERGWPDEYLLFVGSLEPRKNLSLLMEALVMTREKIPVILTGWQAWGDKEWLERARRLGIGDRIRFAGYVDDETLARLYSGTAGLVYPSLYEGFGLPVLEAMARGAPVICSEASSLPETAGDAALYVRPDDAEGLAHCIDRLVRDTDLAGGLRKKGLERAASFTWDRTAVETLRLFRRVADRP